ncbi:allatotropin [Halictus rubicundus]|uniref:allatotropin n=1 Tax=Halictus rubicundus TaxID=77578 RepID=UPI004036246E
MRPAIIIILAFAAGMIAATPRHRNFSHFVKHTARPRVIRGFKPVIMSTAYGFGKRQSTADVSNTNKNERILFTLLRYFPQGIPVEWLLQQMKANPAFASKVTQLLMDGRADLALLTDRSNLERTTWLS